MSDLGLPLKIALAALVLAVGFTLHAAWVLAGVGDEPDRISANNAAEVQEVAQSDGEDIIIDDFGSEDDISSDEDTSSDDQYASDAQYEQYSDAQYSDDGTLMEAGGPGDGPVPFMKDGGVSRRVSGSR